MTVVLWVWLDCTDWWHATTHIETNYFASVCCQQGYKFTLRFCYHFLKLSHYFSWVTLTHNFQVVVKINFIWDTFKYYISITGDIKTTKCIFWVRETKGFSKQDAKLSIFQTFCSSSLFRLHVCQWLHSSVLSSCP